MAECNSWREVTSDVRRVGPNPGGPPEPWRRVGVGKSLESSKWGYDI